MKRLGVIFALLMLNSSASAQTISTDDREAVVKAVIEHLESDYVLPDVGRRGAAELKSALRSKAFRSESSGEAFAAALTDKLRRVTGDGHLAVEYSAKPVEENAEAKAAFNAQEMERYYGKQVNHGVRKAERLDSNVGLLELSVFPPANMGGDTIAAAMNVIANTDALIIDLRNNGGGSETTVSLIASYLFDERQPLSGKYNRPEDRLTQQFTQPYVPGDRFGAVKPVYVLISKRTFSAAEALAYDLQALKRATIVGEPSGGGAHPFDYHRIHPHFILWSVTERSLNPITGKNWQGTGVQPDVRVESAQALETALKLIKERISTISH